MAKHAHLTLKRLEGELPRRKPPGFGGTPKRDQQQHGRKLAEEIASVLEDFPANPIEDGIDPSLILKVGMTGPLNEADWIALGLIVLSEDTDKKLLLFATDNDLRDFRAKIEAYRGPIPEGQKGPRFAGFVEAIESISVAQANDRIGRSFGAIGITERDQFDDADTLIVDVELFHPGTRAQADVFVFRLQQTLAASGGDLLNTYRAPNLILCRVECSGATLKSILDLSEVASIELPPRPDLQMEDLGNATLDDVARGEPPAPGAVTIAIIDSGINSGHPFLAYSVHGGIVGHVDLVDADENGHGTSVASVAIYGDVSSRAETGKFDAPFFARSARVVDGAGQFPKTITVPEVMENVIRRLHADYGCRIFNVSLGDPKLVYNGGKPGAWAQTLDHLATQLDLLIVVSSGNQTRLASLGPAVLDRYPAYLLEADSRIIDPATAANVLTIGSLAHSNGISDDDIDYVGVRSVCEINQPSPFTRSGPGIRGMIKPDLVDYGGTAVWDGPTNQLVNGSQKSSAGIWTFHHQPIDRLFRARSGTSFASPIVAHKAAILLEQYPAAPANFLRAMLALSAEIPRGALEVLAGLNDQAPLMICGNGVADVDDALQSDDSRVVFFRNDNLGLDRFAVYEVPIPEIF